MEAAEVNLENLPAKKLSADFSAVPDFATLKPGVAYTATVDGKLWKVVVVALHDRSLEITRHYYVFPDEKENHDNGSTCDIYIGYRVDPRTRTILEAEKKVFKCFSEKYSSPEDCADEFALLKRQRFCPELFQLNNRIYIVMNYVDGEYLTKASLRQKLSKDNNRRLFEVVNIAWLGTQELFNLHHRTIRGGPWIHTDIRPLNILWRVDDIQLIDFGLSSKDDEDDQPFVEANTAFMPEEKDPYIPPEMKVPKGARASIGLKSDVYSWGFILRDMFKVVEVPEELKSLLDQMNNNMMQDNYADRPSIDDVLLFFTAFRQYCLNPDERAIHIETMQCLVFPGEIAIVQDEVNGAFPRSSHNLVILLEKEKNLDQAIYQHIGGRTVQEKEMFLDALILKRSKTTKDPEGDAIFTKMFDVKFILFQQALATGNNEQLTASGEEITRYFMWLPVDKRLQFIRVLHQYENKSEITILKDNVTRQLAFSLAQVLHKLSFFSGKAFAARRLKYAVTDSFTFFNTRRRAEVMKEVLSPQKSQAMKDVLADLARPAVAA